MMIILFLDVNISYIDLSHILHVFINLSIYYMCIQIKYNIIVYSDKIFCYTKSLMICFPFILLCVYSIIDIRSSYDISTINHIDEYILKKKD